VYDAAVPRLLSHGCSEERKARKFMSKLTIHLTADQQNQLKDATGREMTELYIHFNDSGEFSQEELGQVQGGNAIQKKWLPSNFRIELQQ
jgi:hypothetical protein